MVDLKKVSEAVDGVIRALTTLKQAISTDEVAGPTFTTQAVQAPPEDAPLDNFDSLKNAVQSDKWPEAVNPNLICNTESEKEKLERGRDIIQLALECDLDNRRVLDMGCGEGHMAFAATELRPLAVVGYDTHTDTHWQQLQRPNLTFTSDWQTVANQGPYDAILIYDVLDHLVGEDPVTFLLKARSVLADDGKIYIRCHPFCSRHATHLYQSLNKAYVHLVFSPAELRQLLPAGQEGMPNLGICYPLKTYADFFEKAGLNVEYRRDVTEAVEPFFKIPKIADRIMARLNTNSFPEFQLGLQFIDYVLCKK